jgi:hypothetical protein
MHDRMARYGYSTSRLPQDRDFRSSRAERESPDRMARYSASRLSQAGLEKTRVLKKN